MSFLPDSSCIIAAVSRQHEHHAPAAGEVNTRLGRGERMVLAAPALVEAYSVLTRLPAPARLSSSAALQVLQASFVDQGDLVALDAADYLALLTRAPVEGVVGGRVFDAVIAACARKAGVDVLLTFNERHFRQFAGDGLAVVVPGGM